MPFSHHSHSGQFCGHATDSLEQMVQRAIAQGMDVYCLTEHMPREEQDLYPEEWEWALAASRDNMASGGSMTTATGTTVDARQQEEEVAVSQAKEATARALGRLFEEYYGEARRLGEKYAGQISIVVGMEIDWIRPSSAGWIRGLRERYGGLEMVVGSVHHVHGIPIDYSRPMYEAARDRSGGTDEALFGDYFDLQYEMLQALQPEVVGHFDLIRLLSDAPDASLRRMMMSSPAKKTNEKNEEEEEEEEEGGSGGGGDGAGERGVVWQKIVRNLDWVREYGGIVEINSAGLRKGLREPYPQADICREMIARGINVTLSDDAHGVGQVGTNYIEAVRFIEEMGFQRVVYLKRKNHHDDASCFPSSSPSRKHMDLTELKQHAYFVRNRPC
ncbi:MAG: hypothetical protein Q9163_001760 [Psora crenata]